MRFPVEAVRRSVLVLLLLNVLEVAVDTGCHRNKGYRVSWTCRRVTPKSAHISKGTRKQAHEIRAEGRVDMAAINLGRLVDAQNKIVAHTYEYNQLKWNKILIASHDEFKMLPKVPESCRFENAYTGEYDEGNECDKSSNDKFVKYAV